MSAGWKNFEQQHQEQQQLQQQQQQQQHHRRHLNRCCCSSSVLIFLSFFGLRTKKSWTKEEPEKFIVHLKFRFFLKISKLFWAKRNCFVATNEVKSGSIPTQRGWSEKEVRWRKKLRAPGLLSDAPFYESTLFSYNILLLEVSWNNYLKRLASCLWWFFTIN